MSIKIRVNFSEPGEFASKAKNPVAEMEAEQTAAMMTSPKFNSESKQTGKQQKSTSSRLSMLRLCSQGHYYSKWISLGIPQYLLISHNQYARCIYISIEFIDYYFDNTVVTPCPILDFTQLFCTGFVSVSISEVINQIYK